MSRRTSCLRTPEAYVDFVENEYFANVDRKDLTAVLQCFHGNAAFTIQSAFSSHEGRDTGIRRMFERLFGNYSQVLHKNFEHVADVDNECCAVRFNVENVSADNGVQSRLSNCNFFYFDGGKIKRVYVYMSGGANTLG